MSKNVLPYYKAYPRDFIEGTIGMDLDLKGPYRILIDLIYMQGGYLRDDARYIAGLLGCSIRKWETIRVQLICSGKIDLKNGAISNARARLELESTLAQQKLNAENGAKAHKNKRLPERSLSQPEPEPEERKEQSKTDELPPAEKPSESAFKEAVSAQSKLGRSRLKKATAWSLWQRLSKQHGEDRLLAAYLRYLATDADAKRDGGAYQSGLQVWLKEKSDQWLEQVVRRSRPVDVDTIRAMIKTRDATPSFAWPEDRLGMTESEARKMIA